ncbi:hypothetical protein HYR69_09670, partial [Candidatus Sumerlaeota bacterium]|nr:hypothetical protein [Candidatus Sumerlaeota bacterium]
IKYEADLTVGVPRNINLRVVVGEGSLKGDIQLPLMSDFQVLTGDIELKLPKNSSAYVHMENNFAEEFVIEGFDRMTGKPILQLTHEEFTGSIGAPINFLGNRLEARVNSGKLIIRAAPR